MIQLLKKSITLRFKGLGHKKVKAQNMKVGLETYKRWFESLRYEGLRTL
jgi:hypothetical protein